MVKTICNYKKYDFDSLLLLPTDVRAYIAGFFDGEGCIGVYKSMSKQRGKMYQVYFTRMHMSQRDPAIILWLHETLGGSVRKQGTTHEVYVWCVDNGEHISAVLSIIRPYLRIKGEQADTMIDYIRDRSDMSHEQRDNVISMMKGQKHAT